MVWHIMNGHSSSTVVASLTDSIVQFGSIVSTVPLVQIQKNLHWWWQYNSLCL